MPELCNKNDFPSQNVLKFPVTLEQLPVEAMTNAQLAEAFRRKFPFLISDGELTFDWERPPQSVVEWLEGGCAR